MFPIDFTFLSLIGTIAILPIALLLAEAIFSLNKNSNSNRTRH